MHIVEYQNIGWQISVIQLLTLLQNQIYVLNNEIFIDFYFQTSFQRLIMWQIYNSDCEDYVTR